MCKSARNVQFFEIFLLVIYPNFVLSIELSGLDITRRLHNHLRLDLEGGRNVFKDLI